MFHIILCLALLASTKCSILPEQDSNLYQGDIILRPDQKQRIVFEEAGIPTFGAMDKGKWPNPGSIPYEIPSSLQIHQRARDAIRDAIAELQRKTCLRFRRKRSSEKEGIIFVNGTQCSSPLGYHKAYGLNRVTLGKGCWIKGIVIHEIMHSLGFWHEQARPDRDQYVTVYEKNMIPGANSQFKINTFIDSMGSPYDYDSVMHYGTYYFSKGNGLKTIETKHPADQNRLGQRKEMSFQDAWQLNKRYCGDHFTQPPPTSVPTANVYYCIRHFGGNYITVDTDRISLKLTSYCRDKFGFLSNGALQHKRSKLCVRPSHGFDGAPISLSRKCDSFSRFRSTLKGSVEHLDTRKCLHPDGGAKYPARNTRIVIYRGCNDDRLKFIFLRDTKVVVTRRPVTRKPITRKPLTKPPITSIPNRKQYLCLRHYGWKYVTVSKDKKDLKLTYYCTSKFAFLPNGALQLEKSDLCIEPVSRYDNALLSLKKGCGSNARFERTKIGSFKHINTGKCIHPQGKSLRPYLNTKLTIRSGCVGSRVIFNWYTR